MKKVYGITGGISSGKSTVVDYLLNKGYIVIDADKISREITSSNSEVISEIKKHFGQDYFTNRILDRKKLANLIFNDECKRLLLNSICHPVIKREIIKEINKYNCDIIFIDVPLLYESGFNDLCDEVIVVYVNRDIQINRLMNRDLISFNYALKKIESQMSLNKKRELAGYVIYNNGTYDLLVNNIEELLEDINNGKNISNC